uniref:Venom prothrombin activator omicarin-C non-catalytic subunit n=1 Tax=Oxyuranus microlepidotus TaxID=111177 RepID=FA5V_OXYMI|nr:RecName: Full=Venom prothrombin activator omicarin-C non-catalytic subunit; Short=vPA; AltName: Full=Venom coagulation factor Va-like protein; Contains: RecName: Full=Omicarin-C non-catalytic subunit heavy chain; Contains: RecName: Full=Omicarin-C non-catalytic subunit light chain; Flags: Precursor [Oxyuranus microlepidotus]AAX37266.1 factor V-like nonenzymatic subunit omicarin C [Oxyuranus microlepidotus]
MGRYSVSPVPKCLLLMFLGWSGLKYYQVNAAQLREYRIAAQLEDWDYNPQPEELSRLSESELTFKKIVYREYELDFKQEKPRDELSGLLGPTLRGEVGDILIIYFKNFATQPVSIHPQSAVYNKWSEGSSYSDGTSDVERLDDAVPPGQSFKYVWNITAEIGPKKADPPCLTYAYYSHVNMVRDFNSGLIGALLICKEGSLNANGAQKFFNREYVLMFSVFDESKNWYRKPSLQYTINGFANGTLPDVQACAYDHISWHLIGMSSSPEIFSVHFNGQTLEQNHYKVSTINLVGGASVTANMSVSRTGKWLISSLVAKHLQAGMYGYLNIKDCGHPNTLTRKLSFRELRRIMNWEYFIAAEEITWDYAPEIPSSVDRRYKAQYLDNFSNFIGKKYKKAVFRQYEDGNFTKPTYAIWPKERGILGPVIKAKVRDTVTIVFKNLASRPYSIYVHGVSVSKDAEGAIYPSDPKENITHGKAVEPGQVYTYKWTVLDTDEPTVKDSECITKLYHSAVDMTRDIASGLIGPLLVCKLKALSVKGVQNKADVEQHAVFAVFDENKSWYLEDNIKKYCSNPSSVKKDDPKFYKSNVMYTLNGYASDRTEVLGFHQSEVVQWHLTSVGTVDEIVPVHLSGHTFLSKGKHQDILNLFPMSGESATVTMDNLGTWLLSSWGSCEMSNGMRLRFLDANYDDEDEGNEEEEEDDGDIFADIFSPPEVVKKKEEVPVNFVPDPESDALAKELGLLDDEDNPEQSRSEQTEDDEEQLMIASVLGLRSFKGSVAEEELKHTALALEEDAHASDPRIDSNSARNSDDIAGRYLRTINRRNKRRYYIAAEEVLWDYSPIGKSQVRSLPAKTTFKKAIFRSYLDDTFQTPSTGGEYEKHLGILGPIIRAEVDDVIEVQFRNLASRPYSLHAHGLLYEKSSEGRSYDDNSPELFKKDDAIMPNGTYTYVWQVPPRSGPTDNTEKCKSWAYYSGVNPEKDIHSGLIGPILICQKGMIDKYNRTIDIREFVLFFMVFDEEKSWYFPKSDKSTCEEKLIGVQSSHHTFPAINGIPYQLQGLMMYKDENVHWHLLNMGGPKDIHVVNFHGQTFTEEGREDNQLGVLPLLPGTFASIKMKPSKIGTWLLETEVGENQERGMQALFTVIDKDCKLPMGLASGIIQDSQISASGHVEYWEPKLARLNNTGMFNAWSIIKKEHEHPWIQIDLQRQVVITGIQTQGTVQLLKHSYTVEYFVTYSKDGQNWITFKGRHSETQMHFEGNSDGTTVKENHIDPPIIARYIRLHPTKFYNTPTFRIELLGCEVEGCSVPLGMESGAIKNSEITASSYKKTWWSSWEPFLARLNLEGGTNAWQPEVNNKDQWLQIDLQHLTKITSIITQGATSMTTAMYVKTFSIHYTDDNSTWKPYLDVRTSMEKVFTGNINSDGHVKHFFKPPILSRFIRIIPKTWNQYIALRIELFGCEVF